MANSILIPTFTESFFRFSDPNAVPEHIDAEPVAPNFPNLWAVYMATGQKVLTCALDVVDLEQAELLAAAKRDYLEGTIGLYGYTTDVCILNPNGDHTRFYVGRTLSED